MDIINLVIITQNFQLLVVWNAQNFTLQTL